MEQRSRGGRKSHSAERITDAKPDERMSRPNYEAALRYALGRLRTELRPELLYHNAAHTESDVLPAVSRLARLSNLAEADVRLLEVAAAFHDLGQIRSTLEHERIGIDITSQVLPGFGFGTEEIARITAIILATRLPQTPQNEEQALLADADLDSLGREDFLETSTALWKEKQAQGERIAWRTWLESQLELLRSHRYFTRAARSLRDAGKARNIELLERLIRDHAGDEMSREG